MFQQMKDLTKNIETVSEALDYQEAPVEPEVDPTIEPLVLPADL